MSADQPEVSPPPRPLPKGWTSSKPSGTREPNDEAIKRALELKALGCAILPLQTGTKDPQQGIAWEQAVVNNPAVFLTNPGTRHYGWFPPPGCVGLDWDGDGEKAAQSTIDELGIEMPDTRLHYTPNGAHVAYRWPDDLPRPKGPWFGSLVARWPFGDEGQGYLVGPGCVGTRDGTGELVPYVVGVEAPIAELPRVFAEAVLAHEKPARARKTNGATSITLTGYVMPPEHSVPKGKRYTELVRYSAHLWNMGMNRDEGWELVRLFNEEQFREPKDERTLRADFRRAWKEPEMRRRLGTPAHEQQPDRHVPHERIGVTAREFVARAANAVADDLWAELIPAGSLVLHSGQPKSLKTWLVLDMASAMLQGRTLLGRETKPIERFVYVTREDSDRNIGERLRAFDALTQSPLLDQTIVIRETLPLHSGQLDGWKVELEPCLGLRTYLVIDPLRDFIARGSEKDDDAIREVKLAIRDLQAWHGDLTAHLLHHNTKAQLYGDHRDASGSGALSAMADVLIQHLRDRQDEDDDDETVITIAGQPTGRVVVQGRSVEGGVLRWRWLNPDFELLSASPGKDAILAALESLDPRDGSGVVVRAIAELVGKSPENVRKTLDRAAGKGRVRAFGGRYGVVDPDPVHAQTGKTHGQDTVSSRFADILAPDDKTPARQGDPDVLSEHETGQDNREDS